MTTAKPFDVSKRLVWEAYKRVKANAGAAGIDGQSLEAFERSLADNLYRIWNRMASGSYFPAPVKAVSIPKKAGGKRILGIPTVADRIAQTVVKLVLEPQLEPYFHADSYGYRPGKSAKSMRQAIRSWKLQMKSDKSIEELAYMFGPRIQGWIEYYCRFYRSAFRVVAHHLNRALVRWAMRKYKRLRGHETRAWQWLA